MFERVRATRSYEPPTVTAIAAKVPYYREVPAWERGGKRVLDILTSIVALALFCLVLPLIALAIRLDSRGPVFYSQVRVGINRRSRDRRQSSRSTGEERARQEDRRDRSRAQEQRRVVAEGRPFTIYKLRTMYVNSESDGIRWAQKNDKRITRVGGFLRLTRLDEFPQFYNVLKGDMSVIGPRPERPPFITMLRGEVPGYLDRLRFKPGITGLAQIENGYDESIDSVHRKVQLDLEYMSNFSLKNDLKILVRTVRVVFTGEGAL